MKTYLIVVLIALYNPEIHTGLSVSLFCISHISLNTLSLTICTLGTSPYKIIDMFLNYQIKKLVSIHIIVILMVQTSQRLMKFGCFTVVKYMIFLKFACLRTQFFPQTQLLKKLIY